MTELVEFDLGRLDQLVAMWRASFEGGVGAKEQSGGSLWLYTFARNESAQVFYEREGFRIVARGFEPMWQLEDIKYEWKRPL